MILPFMPFFVDIKKLSNSLESLHSNLFPQCPKCKFKRRDGHGNDIGKYRERRKGIKKEQNLHLENEQKIDYHHVIFPYFTTEDHCSLWKKSSMIFANSAGPLRINYGYQR